MATTTTATTTSLANKRGHKRSVSLENTAPPLMLRSTPSLCNVQQQQQQQQQQHHQQLLQQQSYHQQQQQQQQLAGHTGTLKSRNEQRRFNQKYGSHNNLDDDNTQQGRTKFQNIRQMFELSRDALTASTTTATATSTPTTVSPNVCVEAKEMQSGLQSLPTTLTKSFTNVANKADQQQHKLPQSRKTTTTGTSIAGCGSNVDYQAHLNISETRSQQLQHQPQSQSLSQPPSLSQSLIVEHTNNVHHHNNNNNNNNINNNEINDQSTGGFLRPIAFKPIPFEPDYRISNHHHYCEVPVSGDRYGYGSTPSLVPVQTSSLKFGSTTDLRHVGGGGVGGSIGTASNGIMKGSLSLCTGVGGVGGGFGGVGGILSASSSASSGVFVSSIYASHNNNNNINNNYCNSLMARRRGFKTLKSNDSMESIGQMTELDASMHIHSQNPSQSQCGNNSKTNANANVHGINGVNQSNAANIQQQQNGNNKYMLSAQCELTPSPSDSGISELEAALKDRDSELSYLRQTMEHNEKDKETYWENETKRLKHFYEAQQREYLLKLKKMEQMLALQQFQLKQHKLRHGEQVNKLREQVADLKNELEILRNGNDCLRNSEHNLKETVAYLDKQLADAHNVLAALRSQLEDSEWKVCERNGEIALLKTQLKEANIEITIKDHAIVNLKHEHNNAETQMYQSLHEKNQQRQQQQQQQQRQQQQHQQQLPKQIKTQTTPSNNMNNNDYVCADEQQLSKIIMLKDQVIVALTAELAKLRKELSDLAIAHEYGEEPCGRYTRLKQQLDNLNEICLKTRKYTKQMPEANYDKLPNENNNNNNINNNNDNNKQLDAFMQRLKLDDANLMDMSNTPLTTTATATAKATPAAVIAADMPQQQQKQPQPQQQKLETSKSDDVKNLISKLESSTLDTLIEESTTYAEDIAKLRQKLDDFRINLELERRQWCAEKDKVLNYQKQLQANYINMYQKLRCLDSAGAVNVS